MKYTIIYQHYITSHLYSYRLEIYKTPKLSFLAFCTHAIVSSLQGPKWAARYRVTEHPYEPYGNAERLTNVSLHTHDGAVTEHDLHITD